MNSPSPRPSPSIPLRFEGRSRPVSIGSFRLPFIEEPLRREADFAGADAFRRRNREPRRLPLQPLDDAARVGVAFPWRPQVDLVEQKPARAFQQFGVVALEFALDATQDEMAEA